MEREIKQGYKKTPVGMIPEDWEVKELGEIGTVINGLTYSPDDSIHPTNPIFSSTY